MTNKPYKTKCDTCYQPTWYEVEQPCKRTIWQSCDACGSNENASEQKKCPGTLKIIDTKHLDPRFEQYYKSGQRIEVTYKWGEKERFYIGKSTGWTPCWLTTKRKDSTGGTALLCDSITSITPLDKYK